MKNFAKLVMVATSSVAVGLGVFGTTQSAQAQIINGGFEQPVVPSNLSWTNYDESQVPGWETTATDNRIEIQTCRLFHCGALGTQQYAELNANQVSTLYQDVATTSGETFFWRFFHRGRQGVDTLRLSIIDLASSTTLFSQIYSTGNQAWVEYTGATVATGVNTRWQFQSVSATGGNPSIGNFLDEVYFDRTPPVAATPEPASMLGLLAMGVIGAIYTRKSKQYKTVN